MLFFRMQQCLGPFTMILVEGSSETGLFRHLSNHLFQESIISEIHRRSGSSFFWKCSKFNKSSEKQRKNEKKFFVSEILVSELVALNCLYQKENPFHQQSICQQTSLRFYIALKDTFSKSAIFTVTNKYCKGPVVQNGTVFVPVFHVSSGRVLWNGTF